jgi:UDP-N-acetylglucosamine acyltransferase
MGSNSFIHPTAIIGSQVVIGDNVYIGAYSIIGMRPEYTGHHPSTHFGNSLIIEDNVVIRDHVRIQVGHAGNTIIGNSAEIYSGSHIGHDVIMHPFSKVASSSVICGHVIIHKYANIGVNSSVHQWSVIGEGCMIGAQSFVKGITDEWSIYVGVPAQKIGDNIIGKQRWGII